MNIHEFDYIKEQEGHSTFSFSRHVMMKDILEPCEDSKDIIADIDVFGSDVQKRRLQEMADSGMVAFSNEANGIVVITPYIGNETKEVISMLGEDCYNIKYHVALQIVDPSKYIKLIGSQIGCVDDFVRLQQALIRRAVDEFQERSHTTKDVQTQKREQRIAKVETKRKKARGYQAYVDACQLRNQQIKEAWERHLESLEKRKEGLILLNNNVNHTLETHKVIKGTPVPKREDYM